MRLAHLAGSENPLAIVCGDRVAPLDFGDRAATIDDLIATWSPGRAPWQEAAERALSSRGRQLEPGMLDVPLQRPGKIACVGLNYADHIRETGLPRPERPLIFAKFGSSLIGDGEAICWPAGLTEQVDWEAELGVIIGSRMRSVGAEEALNGVFGYTVANDVSARDLQFSDQQWVRAKSIDTFCPLGPVIVTSDEFGDPQSKRIISRVNGRTMQESTTAEMIFSTAEIISYLSQACTLEPGDLILTGTPWGVGGFRTPSVFLKEGDVVEVEVEGIGTLTNPVGGETS